MNSLVFAAASIKLKSLFMRAYWEVNFDYPLSVFGKIEKPLNSKNCFADIYIKFQKTEQAEIL